jgi:hypothetical protein
VGPADYRRLAVRGAQRRAAAEARTREREALAQRCAALDRQQPPPEDIDATLAAYERLAGASDPASLRWRGRLDRIRALGERLATALAAGSALPATAADDADALAALVGGEQAQVAAVRRRVQQVATQRTLVGALLARRGAPEADPAVVAGLVQTLGGDDPEVRELGQRLDGWRTVQQVAAGMDGRWVIDPEQLERCEQAIGTRAVALAGADHPQVRAWTRRLAELRGPPAPGWAAARGHDRHGPWLDLQVGGAQQRLRWLPPGTFTMGSPADEPGRDGDEAQVRVRLTRGCWIADSECSQGLWQAVMGSLPGRAGGPLLPVAGVAQADALAFCARLGARLPGCRARLPSEAEWEAAARAGDPGPWTGIAADQLASAIIHGGSAPVAVASGPVNALGLHHLLGNVREWCADGWGALPTGALVEDPATPAGDALVVRGGSWGDPLGTCRVANRGRVPATARSPYLGFRLVVEAE